MFQLGQMNTFALFPFDDIPKSDLATKFNKITGRCFNDGHCSKVGVPNILKMVAN
jgi:hypothetical protein